MKQTIEALEAAGLRKNFKIMIGGGQIDEEIRQYVQADGYGRDAIAAVNFCKQWIGE
jgi:5-methyltetrahydrofolate--homocysteine methyltransferase